MIPDMIDFLQEANSTISLDDIKNLPTMTCKTRFGLPFAAKEHKLSRIESMYQQVSNVNCIV
jgi:hypothetical protein